MNRHQHDVNSSSSQKQRDATIDRFDSNHPGSEPFKTGHKYVVRKGDKMSTYFILEPLQGTQEIDLDKDEVDSGILEYFNIVKD